MQGNSQKPGLSAFTSSCQVDMDSQMDAPHYSALLILRHTFSTLISSKGTFWWFQANILPHLLTAKECATCFG